MINKEKQKIIENTDYDIVIDPEVFIKETLKFTIMQWDNVKDNIPPYNTKVLVSPEKGNISINTLIEDAEFGTVWKDEQGYMWKYDTIHW